MNQFMLEEFARSCSLTELDAIIETLESSNDPIVCRMVDWLSEISADKYNEAHP
jgi:hypothetical protein